MLDNAQYVPTQTIEILSEYPPTPYWKIAIITVSEVDYQSFDSMMNDLKKKAMELGSNALVIEEIWQQSQPYSGTFYAVLKTTAIRYK